MAFSEEAQQFFDEDLILYLTKIWFLLFHDAFWAALEAINWKISPDVFSSSLITLKTIAFNGV